MLAQLLVNVLDLHVLIVRICLLADRFTLFEFDDGIEQCAFELQQCWIRPPTELFLLDKLKGRLEESLRVTRGLLKCDHPLFSAQANNKYHKVLKCV